ncbi:hypothetical protein SEA_PCORAL7_11 [Gordonia phage PCoral7]|uniref:Uncharacterized protein n=1 Tax=Gordonia phage Toast TaxID=2599852 RepID=A0A5J6TGW6_9CAUD|nr:head-tail connector protein [Gordonia phage Toast]QFG08072.1 hypothetical protein PBI_TOAST_11 [Gordonia phage Toast]UVF60519.1 hypothetical protein SEA_PCORAL7_11 [Gordonia phage PCoral7]
MSDPTPCEVVLDYERDAIVFDGTALPFPLSGVGARAVVEGGRGVVTITLEVDQVRSVAALPSKPEPGEAPTASPTPEQTFEAQFDAIRGANRG